MKCLLFSREANNWNEANPIGNGTLGAMIFGQTVKERIQINEDSVWSGGPMQRCNPDAKKYLPDLIELLKKGNIVEAERLARQSMFSLYPHMRHYQTLGDISSCFEPGYCAIVNQSDFRLLDQLAKDIHDYASVAAFGTFYSETAALNLTYKMSLYHKYVYTCIDFFIAWT